MQVLHHIGASWDLPRVQLLGRYGITVTEGVFSYIKLDEETYQTVKDEIMSPHIMYAKLAEFTKKELDDAKWVALTGLRQVGYPQPEGTFDYLNDVYETSASCRVCGIIEGSQKSPFRIKTNNVKFDAFQLGWTFDEIFAKRELYDNLFSKFGIGFWSVLIHKTGKESEKIVQLRLTKCDWKLDMTGIGFEACPICKRKKYLRQLTDFLPPFPRKPEMEVFHGQEYFGSGGSAFHLIYMSQSIRQELIRRKIAKWYQFDPVRCWTKT